MKVIRSTSITYKEPLTLKKIYLFLKKVTDCKTNLFLIKNGLFTNIESLTALVSFFLTLKKGDTFLFILEGESADVHKTLDTISNLLNNKVDETKNGYSYA
ncbi:hypothetical protein [Metabacillus rhizolycopersici]|uniref:HPr family phosphocarrier protein n=1 Tax=Metabacillus rhizolycopersici TaxID=2875709 RepID=A0ABS7UXN5_9BACI|nr:hypothetical protein [Metabacillus rhizolycopersici]MBZ5753080.1 hypothetical protein [Metabacillus rhizolycopersici]